MPLEDRLKQPLHVLVTWLSVAQPAIEEARVRGDTDSEMEEDFESELEFAPDLDDELLAADPG